MAQVIWGFNFRPRNEGNAISYQGEIPQTGESSFLNSAQSMMQIEALMETPGYTNLQYFRLLKPNSQINPNISLQLHCSGFLEPVSMTCAGYTTKKGFNEFLSCFGVLAPEILSENNDERIACLKVLDKLDLVNYLISETKVFLKAAHMAELTAQKIKVLERAARTIQRPIHAHMLRKRFILLRNAAVDIQSLCRGMLARKAYETQKKVMTQKKKKNLKVEFKLRKETEEVSLIQEEEAWLNQCISQNVGFSNGRPVAACMIHEFLLRWRLYEVDKTRIFDRIMENITASIEMRCSNEKLAYWLSNSSALLMLLRRTLNANGVNNSTSERRRIRSVQLFRQKLTTFLEKIYGMLRENLKNEISPVLVLCIQVPRKLHTSLTKGTSRRGNHATHHMMQWQRISKSLTNYFNIFKANYVPSILVHKLFTQVFSFINVQLFNSLLLRRECCSFSNGKYVKQGLTNLGNWCLCTTKELGSAWDKLKHIRQAVEFLVAQGKPEMTVQEFVERICPDLNIQQVHRISTMYWDDRQVKQNVPPEVIEKLTLKTKPGSSFLLDDDSSIPFTVDEICKSMAPIEISDIGLPPLIQDKYGCNFSSIEDRINNIALIFSSKQTHIVGKSDKWGG